MYGESRNFHTRVPNNLAGSRVAATKRVISDITEQLQHSVPEPIKPVEIINIDAQTAVKPSLGSVQSGRRVLVVALVGVLVIMVGGFTAYLRIIAHSAVTSLPPTTTSSVVSAETPVKSVATHMMFVGDIFWGRAIETAAISTGKGAANLFRGFTNDDKKGYDAWIGNLECPVSDKPVPFAIQASDLIFNCRPDYMSALADWFDVVSLANNHTANRGVDGFAQTRANLEANKLQYFGTYDMNNEKDICEVVTVAARTEQGKKVTMPVAICGYDYVGAVTPKASQMQIMATYAKLMPVIAVPHMGVEYRPTAEQAKVDTYRLMIDSGADMVVASHPHVVQNSEVYKGKLIAYSMGNFLFDQQRLGSDNTESLAVGLQMTIHDQQAIKLYSSLGDTCRTFQDDCLAQLSARLTTRPKIDVVYDFQYYDESSGTPVRANQTVADEIKARASIASLTTLATEW